MSSPSDAFTGEPHRVDLLARVEELELRAAADAAKIQHLNTALLTARRIGMAMGIVMAATRCSDVRAFARLRSVSQSSGQKLREVADDVVLSGSWPPPK